MDSNQWHTGRIQDNLLKEAKRRKKKVDDHRSEYEIDRCKVIHSYTFRRLQGKIQIVSGRESDFHRNRLTHSLEVASIAQNIYNNIRFRNKNSKIQEINDFFTSQEKNVTTLFFTIGLLHDIGHAPFGHGGEVALNYKMHKYGGFEGNAQTLRLITKISPLSLTIRTLLGVLKYPANYKNVVNQNYYPKLNENRATDFTGATRYLINREHWEPPKCYYESEEDIVSALLYYISESDKEEFQKVINSVNNKHKKTQFKTFDCSVMDMADDISYSIHDLEDAIFFGQISKDDLEDFFSKHNFLMNSQEYPSKLLSEYEKRKEVISELVHQTIVHTNIHCRAQFSDPLLKFYVDFEDDNYKSFITDLKILVSDKLIKTQHVRSIVQGGMVVIMQLFDAFIEDYKLLPPEEIKKIENTEVKSQEYMRVIADYIAGMTDQFLFKMHQRIYGTDNRNTFEFL
ncbi:anti-phage deoxyguanosine triphosphatase [Legionella pneumophila]|uniref:anti-phage deoxyguanosine triphosphatase n=1 Tax=Legionella pneumophila TaxID=446 RepID=UPI000DF9189F|nr:anti-phage deoxyguanosine triphosphatase [Legionella pneumophila]HAT9212400.1 dNTP triphosphohydrolase [Legionella pneumophila subsp. pneumophila]MCK1849220.1 dGTPase [Legionella pneumophila]MDI9852494.1 anti-phage deoxyguanosine triphosphatase [Legionella pneumophila]STX91498.1 deoxyguanosine triphosphate triphosphohydrolase [Legionella pneumophila]HAT1830923.1 dNTP triphosphohydrolase [Legionella pneumophila]